jgi:GSCFA family
VTILTTLSDLKHRIRARIPLSVQDRLSVRGRKRRLNAQVDADPDILLVEVGNDRFTEGREWFRGDHVNYMPSRTNLFEKNAIQEYVLKGWLPEKPFISKDHYITAFGSCFAAHVSNYLLKRGYRVFDESSASAAAYVIRCGEGMVNTFAVAQQFQWAYGEKEFDESLWFDKSGLEASYDAGIRERTRAIFEQTDIFLITLGLSEVWYSKRTGDVFWRAIPRSKFDPLRHGFKVSTVAENLENLNTIYRIIRERRPNASIIFTLSPIPLLATFRPVSCITANSVSKSILRVALDELHRAHSRDKRLFYFPSFEMVKEFFRDAFRGDNRHVRDQIVGQIMESFAKHYLV